LKSGIPQVKQLRPWDDMESESEPQYEGKLKRNDLSSLTVLFPSQDTSLQLSIVLAFEVEQNK